MAAKLPQININFAELQERLESQFRGLNPNDPSTWPLLPRLLACVGVTVVLCVALWFAWISGVQDELNVAQEQEKKLKEEYRKKLGQAINLDALRKQREQVQQYVTQIEKQLPGKSEMDALLSDINQAGVGRSLQFEYFRPGSVVVREYYAELPISIRVTGKFHDVGAFAGDIAQLSRIVTLNNITLSRARDGTLAMDCVAKTFRYLDATEVDSQRRPGGKQ